MMVGYCIGRGFRSARRSPGLVAILWCWTLILATLAAYPAWLWLGRAFDLAPESDRMLNGFNFDIFAEAGQYDRSPVQRIVMASLMGAALLSLLANPFIAGGLIETLRCRDEATSLQRFFRGAGRYFWRYLRLLVYGFVTAGIVMGILSPVFRAVARRLEDSPWEPAPLVGSAVQAGVLMAVGALLLLALDFARIRTAVDESRRTLRIWFSSLRFVLRRIPSVFGMLAVPVAVFAAVAALYLAFCSLVPTNTSGTILLAVVLQQVVMYVRAGLRVALVSSEFDYFGAVHPTAAAMFPEEAVPAEPATPAVVPPQEDVAPEPENAPRE